MEGAHIEAQRRPAVLARHFDAILQLHHRRPGVRVGLALLQDVDQRIHFLDACGIDAARPVILELRPTRCTPFASSAEGKRVAVVALILNAVEPECQRATTVDQSAMIQPILLRHFAGSSIGAVRSTFSMACVSVSRVTRTMRGNSEHAASIPRAVLSDCGGCRRNPASFQWARRQPGESSSHRRDRKNSVWLRTPQNGQSSLNIAVCSVKVRARTRALFV